MCEAGGLCVHVRETISPHILCAFLCVLLVCLFTLVCAITFNVCAPCASVRVCACETMCEWAVGGWKCCLCIFMQSNYVDLIGFVYVESVSPPVMYYCCHGQMNHTHMYTHTLMAHTLLSDWIMWSVSSIIRGFIFSMSFKDTINTKMC